MKLDRAAGPSGARQSTPTFGRRHIMIRQTRDLTILRIVVVAHAGGMNPPLQSG